MLVVEDSDDDATLMELGLRRAGIQFELERVDTAPSLLDALARAPWDVVLCDHRLPFLDSSHVLRLLRQRRPDLPCVIVSGRIGEEAVVTAMREGAAGYVPKDHLDRLAPAVRRVVEEAVDRRTRAAAEAARRQEEARCALAVAGANDGVWDWDLVANSLYFSTPSRVPGDSRAPDPGVHATPAAWFERIHPDDVDRARGEIGLHLRGEVPQFRAELRMRRADGSWGWMLARGIAVRDDAGRPIRMTGSMSDITAQKETEARLTRRALRDPLTGLPNRALFRDRLATALARIRRNPGTHVAVLFIDLDGFKQINDTLGHAAGDELLRGISHRLEHTLRPGDTVARIGGDEFAMLLGDITARGEAVAVADRILVEADGPLTVAGVQVATAMSIGIAVTDQSALHPDAILHDADAAMYRAKAQGKGRWVVFDSGMHADAHARRTLESELREAVRRGDFRVLYQPIVRLESGRIHGFESLIRWVHPTRGMVAPVDFIAVAEQAGLMPAIGQLVLADACRAVHAWRAAGPPERPPTVAINLSARQFGAPGLIDAIAAELGKWRLPGDALELEVGETALVENADSAPDLLRRLKRLGVRTRVDDFGTGWSSLHHLHRLSLQGLKVDRAFVADLPATDAAPRMIESVLALATTLGLDVVAGGVETPAQAAALRSMGCPLAQGILFSPPLDARDACEILGRELTAA